MESPELFYEMTVMFIQNMLKSFDKLEVYEEEKLRYLEKLRHFCQNASITNNYEPTTVEAQDGWLMLKDLEGTQHQVPYRGVWSIETLKTFIETKHGIAPNDQHLAVFCESFSSHD
jgi:hypothetical protein